MKPNNKTNKTNKTGGKSFKNAPSKKRNRRNRKKTQLPKKFVKKLAQAWKRAKVHEGPKSKIHQHKPFMRGGLHVFPYSGHVLLTRLMHSEAFSPVGLLISPSLDIFGGLSNIAQVFENYNFTSFSAKFGTLLNSFTNGRVHLAFNGDPKDDVSAKTIGEMTFMAGYKDCKAHEDVTMVAPRSAFQTRKMFYCLENEGIEDNDRSAYCGQLVMANMGIDTIPSDSVIGYITVHFNIEFYTPKFSIYEPREFSYEATLATTGDPDTNGYMYGPNVEASWFEDPVAQRNPGLGPLRVTLGTETTQDRWFIQDPGYYECTALGECATVPNDVGFFGIVDTDKGFAVGVEEDIDTDGSWLQWALIHVEDVVNLYNKIQMQFVGPRNVSDDTLAGSMWFNIAKITKKIYDLYMTTLANKSVAKLKDPDSRQIFRGRKVSLKAAKKFMTELFTINNHAQPPVFAVLRSKHQTFMDSYLGLVEKEVSKKKEKASVVKYLGGLEKQELVQLLTKQLSPKNVVKVT
jgi:hypothetical protein